MKVWRIIFILAAFWGFNLDIMAQAAQPCTMLFFDLGNTILDTSHRDQNGDILRTSYFPGAKEYLEDLRKAAYPLGLVVNVPEGWGLFELKNLVASLWSDLQSEMDWSLFEETILVPGYKIFRKPHPKMFCEAVRIAENRGCQALYQGEDFLLPQKVRLEIIHAARSAGMTSVLVQRNPVASKDHDVLERRDLIPVEEINSYMESHPPQKTVNYCEGY